MAVTCGSSFSHEDRISLLPDEIILLILSMLTMREVGRTIVLSKRWNQLWKNVQSLDFDASSALDRMVAIPRFRPIERRNYVRWVNRVLQLLQLDQSQQSQQLEQPQQSQQLQQPKIFLEKFRVCFDLSRSSQNDIDSWIGYALERQVQSLELNFFKHCRYGESLQPHRRSYPFPERLLGLSNNGHFGSSSHTLIDFKFLRELCFKSVNVTGRVLQFFLDNCPLLESLVVHGSIDLRTLQVRGPSLALRFLEIWKCFYLYDVVVSNATNLVSLKICEAHKILLENLPVLVEASVQGTSTTILDKTILWFSSCLCQLTVLTLDVMRGERKALDGYPVLPRLKQFILIVNAWEDRCIMAYTSLFRVSPNLEKFVLKVKWTSPTIGKRKRLGTSLRCPFQRLKVIELLGYYGRKSEVEFVYYLLENAVALEKIIVDPRDQQALREPLRVQAAKQEEGARRRAKEQLEVVVPPTVELVIL